VVSASLAGARPGVPSPALQGKIEMLIMKNLGTTYDRRNLKNHPLSHCLGDSRVIF
jgi:hypothetical protein